MGTVVLIREVPLPGAAERCNSLLFKVVSLPVVFPHPHGPGQPVAVAASGLSLC